jgi:caspase domain-containing protein
MRRWLSGVLVVAAVVLPLGPPAHAGPKPNIPKWAVLVGIDVYPGKIVDNVGSQGDVSDLRTLLIGNGFPADHILTITEKNATAANIRAGMRFLVDHATDNSLSVFHYSGHIKQLSGDKDRDGEVLDEYLWPYDSKFIADAELSGTLKQVRGWTWIDIAGCEGAGLADGVTEFNRVFTAASQESEKAYEHPQWHNSVFTGLLVDFGGLHGQADRNQDGRFSIQESFNFAAAHAPAVTRNQKRGAQHPFMAGGDGTEWYLDAPQPVAPPPPKQSSPPPPSGGGGVDGDDPTR